MVRKRKIIVYIATSADGSVDWLDRPRPKGNYGMGAFYQSIDTVLWGRKTCDMALDFQKKGVSGSAFDTRVKNYVFTRTLPQSSVPAGVEFVSEPVKAFATRLRKKKGKDIWMMGVALGSLRRFSMAFRQISGTSIAHRFRDKPRQLRGWRSRSQRLVVIRTAEFFVFCGSPSLSLLGT
jgi:hypothetical protein